MKTFFILPVRLSDVAKAYALLAAIAFLGCLSPAPACERPYSAVDGVCCLDSGGDGVCDRIAAPTTQEPASSSTITSTSTTSPSTTTASRAEATATSTTVLKPACAVSSDCGAEVNGSLGCDGNKVVGQVLTPICSFGGTASAKCAFKARDAVFEHCDGKICFAGGCYPGTCGNRVLDYNELDVDCGGSCPPCGAVKSRECVWDVQCGRDYYLDGFRCYNGDVVRYKAVFDCLENRTCTSETLREVYDFCRAGYTCVEGEKRCQFADRMVPVREQLGACNDCKQNQNETDVDCGGPCLPCAPQPPADDPYVIRELDLASKIREVYFKGHGFRYLGPVMDGTCTMGATLQVIRPDGTKTEVSATRYRNGGAANVVVGFISGDDASAKIWANVY